VRRCLRLHITKSDDEIILENDRGWNFSRDDLFKKGFAHERKLRFKTKLVNSSDFA